MATLWWAVVAAIFVVLSLPSAGTSAQDATRVMEVRYSGASALAADAVLHATVRGRARVVAVTFFVDGRPVGSDTTSPFGVELTPGLVGLGRHRLRVVAVDRLGRRRSSPTRTVTVTRAVHATITASPSVGLNRALHELARGGRVKLLPGVYRLAQVRLGSGALLVGSGPKTVVEAPAGPYWSLLIAAGTGIRIADLTLDGGGPGGGFGYGVEVQSGSSDIHVQRVSMRHVRSAGLHAWGAYSGVTIQDSSITGGGFAEAGVLAGESGAFGKSRDTSVIRCRIRGFKSFGVSFSQAAHGQSDAALHAVALDNVVSDITDPAVANGSSEGGIWSGGVEAAIIANRIARTGWDGIETVGSSTNVSVVGNRITDTPTGIYVEHATTSSLFADNEIGRVGAGINVEWWYSGVGSVENTFVRNSIFTVSKAGIFLDVGADRNEVAGNRFRIGAKPAIILQGSSKNQVRGNRLCASKTPVVTEQLGRWDTGQVAYPSENTIAGNLSGVVCRPRGKG